jgi:type 1 glutamine amidotransferase
LLVCGGCCHDYDRQKDIISKGLAERANIEVTIAYDPDKTTKHLNPVYEKEDWYKDFDVIIHDECSSDMYDLAMIDRILKPHKEGLPAVVLHCAMHCYRPNSAPKSVTSWMEFTGLNTNHHGAQLPISISFTDKESPITKGMEDWTTIKEELYHEEALLPTSKGLAGGKQKESDTVVWTNLYNGKTKVFGTTIGHNNETVADGRYLDLVTRGLLWSTGHLTDDGKPAPGYEAKK